MFASHAFRFLDATYGMGMPLIRWASSSDTGNTSIGVSQFAAFMKRELSKYEPVVKASGAKVD